MISTKRQKNSMVEGNPFWTVLWFSVPTVAGLLSTAVYHLADAWFIYRLGAEASAAVSVAFPIQTLMQTVGFTLGLGGGSLLSRKLGAQKAEEAHAYARTALWSSLWTGALIAAVGLLWLPRLVALLGAEESVAPFAASYLEYLLWAAPAMCVSFVLSQLLRAKGYVWISALGISVGNLLNILLDPLLIFGAGLGIAGASLATLISHCLGLLLLLLMHHAVKKKQEPRKPRSTAGFCKRLSSILIE